MKTLIRNANIYDSGSRSFFAGDVLAEGGRFAAVGTVPDVTADVSADISAVDAGGCYLVPGLVDVHTHGRAGGDFVSAGTDKLREMARS